MCINSTLPLLQYNKITGRRRNPYIYILEIIGPYVGLEETLSEVPPSVRDRNDRTLHLFRLV